MESVVADHDDTGAMGLCLPKRTKWSGVSAQHLVTRETVAAVAILADRDLGFSLQALSAADWRRAAPCIGVSGDRNDEHGGDGRKRSDRRNNFLRKFFHDNSPE